MLRIKLEKEKWHCQNSIWFAGHIIANGEYLFGNEAVNYLDVDAHRHDLNAFIGEINGSFSIIVNEPDNVIVISDKVRSFPVFFSHVNDVICISDDADFVLENLSAPLLDEGAAHTFQKCGFTFNNKTLIEDLYVTEPYDIISFKNGGWDISSSYRPTFLKPDTVINSFNEAAKELDLILNRVFKELFENLSDRPIAIPLSGGYDSRLVACMAKKYHKGDILTYTYGVKDNCEIRNARNTAETLGLKWVFVEYNEELIAGFIGNNDFVNYYQYAAHYSSAFWLQDYFAVRELKVKGLVASESVFILGLSADGFAGSHIYSSFKRDSKKQALLDRIFSNNFSMVKSSKKERENIIGHLSDFIEATTEFYNWQAYENWQFFHYHSKFVINSARVYRYFGFDFYLPFWHNDFVNFFADQPFEFKLSKKLYDTVLTKIFQTNGVFFGKKELQVSMLTRDIQLFKKTLKRYLPAWFVNKFIDLSSPILYDRITDMLQKDMGKENVIAPKQSNFYNAYIFQWYLHKVRVSILK